MDNEQLAKLIAEHTHELNRLFAIAHREGIRVEFTDISKNFVGSLIPLASLDVRLFKEIKEELTYHAR